MANINKIKLSGTTYNIQDLNATKTVELTQAEYDALPATAKTSNSLFIITDAQGADLSNYYTKTEADDLLDTKLDVTAYTPTDLSNYYTKSETSGATEISTALASKADTATTYTKTETDNAITAATSTKQDTLVSGTNIKTINSQSILGEGNITIQGGSGGKAVSAGTNISITTGETADTINCTLPISTTSSKVNLTLFSNSQEIQNPYSVNFGYSNSFGVNPTWIYNYGTSNSTPMYGNKYYVNFGENNSLEGYGFEYTFGNYLKSVNQYEFACGKYNKSNSGTLFSVGNGTGTSSSARHNAFEIRDNGDIYISKNGQDVKLQDQLGGGGSSYTAGDGIDITNDVISVTGKVDTSAITTSVTSESTDAQVPSAKAVYDMVGNINTILESI